MHKRLSIFFLSLALTACSSQNKDDSESYTVGEKVVKTTCKVCHAQGINGAPIIGNAKMWEPRVAQGKATLVQHAMEGYGLMPAKGGNETLTQTEIESAISYMLAQLK